MLGGTATYSAVCGEMAALHGYTLLRCVASGLLLADGDRALMALDMRMHYGWWIDLL